MKILTTLILLNYILIISLCADPWDESFKTLFKARRLNDKGDGKTFPKPEDTVTAHYKGTYYDEATKKHIKFDSSYDREDPIEFTLGIHQVITCWDEVIQRMSLNEKVAVVCPYELAYGEDGMPPIIPSKTDLEFEIELLKVVRKKEKFNYFNF
jgi:FK506-binding protein 1